MADVDTALARLYDLDLSTDPGDLELYFALAERTGGPIVELCAGTGRITVPLAAAGHEVLGVDFDPAMLARARLAADGQGSAVSRRVTLLEADLFEASIPRTGTYHLAILALNSILLLGGVRRQRRAIAVLAELLAPGGVAVIDAWQPLAEDLVRFDGRLGLEWLRHDQATGTDVTKLAAAWYDGARAP